VIIHCNGLAPYSRAQQADQRQRLESLLSRFQDADGNKDGTLTIEESQAYNAAHL
jgi:hypothetical protein